MGLAVNSGIKAKMTARALQTRPWTGHRRLFGRTGAAPRFERLLIGAKTGLAGEDLSGWQVADPIRAVVVDSPSLRAQASGYPSMSGAPEPRTYLTRHEVRPKKQEALEEVSCEAEMEESAGDLLSSRNKAPRVVR
jgi:hypothetical protein